MTKQVINTGTVANDGTGDTIRAAMTKTNSNFQEIYGALGDGSVLKTIVDGVANELAFYSDPNTIARTGGLSFDRTTKRMRLDGTTAVGGTGAILTLADKDGSTMNIFEYGNSANVSPGIILVKHRGTIATPLAPLTGDLLGSYSVWSTLDGSAETSFSAGRVSWLATEGTTQTGVNTRITLQCRVDGTVRPVLESNADGSLKVFGAYTLPKVDGTAGQVLSTNGSGVLTWATTVTNIPSTINAEAVNIAGHLTLLDGTVRITSTADSIEGYLTYYGLPNMVGVGVLGRAADATLPGGNVALIGGDASAAHKGGDVNITGGADWNNQNGLAGSGGNINIFAGQGGNDNDASVGGNINIYAGPASKFGGDLVIEAGSTYGGSAGEAGDLTLRAGSVSTGTPGDVLIEAGMYVGGEYSETIPGFNGKVDIAGRDIILTAVQKIILKGGDIGAGGGHLQLVSLTSASRDEIAADYWGKGTVFYNETLGSIQVNTSDVTSSFKTLFSLEELKAVAFESTDFADFKARIAAL